MTDRPGECKLSGDEVHCIARIVSWHFRTIAGGTRFLNRCCNGTAGYGESGCTSNRNASGLAALLLARRPRLRVCYLFDESRSDGIVVGQFTRLVLRV